MKGWRGRDRRRHRPRHPSRRRFARPFDRTQAAFGYAEDVAKIVEMIKARIQAKTWDDDVPQVRKVLHKHLGWYAANNKLESLVKATRRELRG